MAQAISLASRGLGHVEPNPMVGAVVLAPGGRLVGEGWHQRFGGPHAEVNALSQAGSAAHGGTLYVTLEPCCHYGKTPPCTDSVLAANVRRVVVAMRDPFPQVDGGGIRILREAGVEVTIGVLGAEACRQNAPYRKLLRTGRPWVIAKWAMTLDGKIASASGESKWISNEQSRAKVHELRGRVDAILVGRGTLLADDPLLTARPPGARTATRVVVTHSGELPSACKLLCTAKDAPVLVYVAAENASRLQGWRDAGVEVVGLPTVGGTLSPLAILDDLGRRRFTNVLVEGGAGLLGAFHDAEAIDETWVFVAPKLLGGERSRAPLGGAGRSMATIGTALESHHESFGADVLIRSVFTAT